MRISLLTCSCLLFFSGVLILSCKKKDSFDSTAYQQQRLTELVIPLQKGKYITYRMDSTVFTNFGRTTEIHSYLVKHVVDTAITDNLGRPSFRIFTYLSDTTGTQPWQPNGSYFITVLDDHMELTEDNMRVIKLHLPISLGSTWKGNSYLSEDPYGSLFNFSNDDNMAAWDFVISGTNESVTLNGISVPNVVTVSQDNEPNVIDTLQPSSNTVVIPDSTSNVWITGNATDVVSITPPDPASVGNNILVCNRSNFPAVLNNITVPPGYNRNYSYINKEWGYPVDNFNNVDTTLGQNAIYSSLTFSAEKYAVSIGLVYRELTMWEFQPTYNADDGYKTGFGIKMWMVDHN